MDGSLLLVPFIHAGFQEAVVREPTPPPDRYDRAHDRRLFDMWGRFELALGPFDDELPAQPAALRPDRWHVVAAQDPNSPDFVAEAIRLAAAPKIGGEPRLVEMPEESPMRGSFLVAETSWTVAADEIRFVRAPGVQVLFVNGAGFAGDPAKRGWLGVPVSLRAGANRIAAAGIRDGFEVELWKPMTRMVMASWAVEVEADGPRMHDVWDHLVVPLFNASLAPAEHVHMHFDYACNVGEEPGMSEFHDGGYGVPLGMVPGLSYLFDVGKDLPSGPELLAPLATYVYGDAHGERRLLRLRVDRPVPRLTVRDKPLWPPIGTGLLVAESTGSDEFNAEAFALARFFQQRLWERGGILVPLVSDEAFRAGPNRWSAGKRAVVRVGPLASGEPPGLHALSEPRGSGNKSTVYAVRADSTAALRLAYSIEPLFRALGDEDAHWSTP